MLRSRRPEAKDAEKEEEKEEATPQPWTDEMRNQIYGLIVGYSIVAIVIVGVTVYGLALVYKDIHREYMETTVYSLFLIREVDHLATPLILVREIQHLAVAVLLLAFTLERLCQKE